MKLRIRPAAGRDSADRTFVVSTWSSSYKKSYSAGLIHTDDWATVMRPQLERILEREGSTVLIACDDGDQGYFYGWIAGDVSGSTPIVYYVYCKEPYRRAGVAHSLFAALGVSPYQRFVYICRPTNPALLLKAQSARFNPLEVRYPKESRRKPL